MNKLTYTLIAAAGLFISSCYEDKGQYDYLDNVTEVKVMLEKSYGVKKEKSAFSYTITPKLQVPEGYEKNLSYEWYMNTERATEKGDLVGTDPTFTLKMDPAQGDIPTPYYIRLYVTDNLTKAVSFQSTQLEVINPYTFSWLVLHETDGHAEIGAVEYLGGEILVTPDAYTRDKGSSLTGKPLSMWVGQDGVSWGNARYKAQSVCWISTTNAEESGVINPGNAFDLFGKWSDILHTMQREEYFSLENNVISQSGTGGYGWLMMSGGRIFHGKSYSPVMYLMAPLEAETEAIGDYHITQMASGPNAGVGFDENGHRFLNLGLQTGDYWYEMNAVENAYDGGTISIMPANDGNAMDPSRPIPADQKVIAMMNGYHYGVSGIAPWQRYTIYAYAIAGTRSYVYPFQCRGLTGTDPCIPNYYEFTTPEGIDEHTPFTTGTRFNNVLFYAVGNKVYRLDATTGNTTLIYQHEDANAKIAALKMACEGSAFDSDDDSVGTEDYGIPYNRCLGAAFNLPDGTGEFVVLQLGTNGRLLEEETKYPSTQVHRGFGPIKSIAFI